MKKAFWPLLFSGGIIIALDQMSKIWVRHSIAPYETISLIPGFFNLVQVRNRGMAFGVLNRADAEWSSYILITASFVAIALLLFWFAGIKQEGRGALVGLSLVVGGAVGNLIDRLRFHEVIDFLDFHIGGYHWPAFNLADSAITVGTLWLAVYLLFSDTATKKKTSKYRRLG